MWVDYIYDKKNTFELKGIERKTFVYHIWQKGDESHLKSDCCVYIMNVWLCFLRAAAKLNMWASELIKHSVWRLCLTFPLVILQSSVRQLFTVSAHQDFNVNVWLKRLKSSVDICTNFQLHSTVHTKTTHLILQPKHKDPKTEEKVFIIVFIIYKCCASCA